MQGKFQDALRLFNEAAAIDSFKYEIYYHIGIIQKQLGNLKPAFMAYAKTIELNPHYIPAYNNLGIVYAASKEYTKAITVLHQGLALERNNPLLHFNYGVALMAHKQFEEAALEYETALRYKADWDEALNNWGVVLFKQQRAQALEIFTKLLERNPNNYRALNNKGVVLAALGRTQEALTHFQLTLTVVPKHQKAARNLKRIMNQRRNPKQSHDAFQPFEIIGMIPAQDTEHEFFTIKKPKSLEKAKAGKVAASKAMMIPSEQVQTHNSEHNIEPEWEWGFESIERPLLVKLLKYLHLLTKSLPQQQEEEFFKSKTRLDLEQIISNLELRT
jgi:tetratricopeptide (TPR) repeat protein